MSEVIGDTSHLHTKTVHFNAVHEIIGSSGSGSFALESCTGFRHLVSGHASVLITDTSLSCSIIGPNSPDKAVSAQVCVIPSEAGVIPTNTLEVLTVGGSAHIQQSLYVGVQSSSLAFGPEVNHQVKPRPLVGSLPQVCYSYKVEGGDADTRSYLRISGTATVDGIGFARTW